MAPTRVRSKITQPGKILFTRIFSAEIDGAFGVPRSIKLSSSRAPRTGRKYDVSISASELLTPSVDGGYSKFAELTGPLSLSIRSPPACHFSLRRLPRWMEARGRSPPNIFKHRRRFRAAAGPRRNSAIVRGIKTTSLSFIASVLFMARYGIKRLSGE